MRHNRSIRQQPIRCSADCGLATIATSESSRGRSKAIHNCGRSVKRRSWCQARWRSERKRLGCSPRLPQGSTTGAGPWAQQRLRNATLRDEQGEERGVLLDLWQPQSRRLVARYVRESQQWFSVTPVVIPGLDDGKQSKAEGLFLKAVVHAGLPLEAIESVTLRKAPFWPGAEHPRGYFVPDYLRPFGRWHAAMRFSEPVPGPLAIGAGRHVGLGLFAAADS